MEWEDLHRTDGMNLVQLPELCNKGHLHVADTVLLGC